MNKIIKKLSLGDVNPEEYGGGVVFYGEEDGCHVLEYTHGLETEHPESHGMEDESGLMLDVYRVPLDEPFMDTIGQDESSDVWKKLADFIDFDRDALVRWARSSKAEDILHCVEIYASHYGWHELDHYPMRVTYGDLCKRWAS